MKIGKYTLDLTEFEWRPWFRVEIEYEGEGLPSLTRKAILLY